MNQQLLKYMFSKNGQLLFMYFMKPSQFMHYIFTTRMNQKSGFQIVDFLTRLCYANKIKISLSGIHLFSLLYKKHFHPYYSTINMIIFCEHNQIQDIEKIFTDKFKNIIFFHELGTILILPDTICNEIGGSNYIIMIHVCIFDKDCNEYKYVSQEISSKKYAINNNLIDCIDYNHSYVFSVYYDVECIIEIPQDIIPSVMNDHHIQELNINKLLHYIK